MDKYSYWYGNISGVGHDEKLRINDLSLTPEDVYKMTYGELSAIYTEAVTDKIVISRKEWDLDGQWEALLQKGILYVSMTDPDYPERLRILAGKSGAGMPFGLWYKGRLPDNDRISAAVVGARMCSPYGMTIAKEIGRILGENDVLVISGLARGVDGIAQRGTLDGGGESFGVLGCGVDICYPQGNLDLYMELEERGGLISEQPPGMKPLSCFFPARNRIISGLSDMVIVVEAKKKSGSLITADMALEQGRDVVAVPGRITDKTSEGCNYLIYQGAEIYIGPETLEKKISEIAEARQMTCSFKMGDGRGTGPALDRKEAAVYSCLGLEPKKLETLLEECSLTFAETLGALMDLEIKGYVKEASKNYYYISG